jgi:hypothetical protein
LAIPTHLNILSNKKWFEDKKTVNFATHFNQIVEALVIEYDCKIECDNYNWTKVVK